MPQSILHRVCEGGNVSSRFIQRERKNAPDSNGTLCLQNILKLDCCIGIIGGKPKHSLYFVGFQGERRDQTTFNLMVMEMNATLAEMDVSQAPQGQTTLGLSFVIVACLSVCGSDIGPESRWKSPITLFSGRDYYKLH